MSLLTSAATNNFMSDILNKNIVLVLNRNWQAINIRTPADAFCQMATNAATALDSELGDGARAEALRPVKWDEWTTLPIRDGDIFVRTASSPCRPSSWRPGHMGEPRLGREGTGLLDRGVKHVTLQP